jgi:catechol 2,3-dioxygenase-like lactoylglutathione lyase family enzyme
VTCSCCGAERVRVATVGCRDDVRVCAGCVRWLRRHLGVVDATPILPVIDLETSAAYYAAAGFDVRRYDGGGYAFVTIDDESVFDLGVAGPPHEPGTDGAACYLTVEDVDAWHRRLDDLALAVTPVEPKPWGMRELTLTDPDGNRLRFGCPS